MMTPRSLGLCVAAFGITLLSPLAAQADEPDPLQCSAECVTSRTPLGEHRGRALEAVSCQCPATSGHLESAVALVWEGGKARLFGGMMGGRISTLTLRGDTIVAVSDCSDRLEPSACTLTERFTWSATTQRFTFHSRERVVRRDQDLERAREALRRGEHEAALALMRDLDAYASPSDDNEARLQWLMKIHDRASQLHRGGDVSAAAALASAALNTPPIAAWSAPHVDAGERMICYGEPTCKDGGESPYLVVAASDLAAVRALTDLGYFLEQADQARQAVALLSQVARHFPEYAPVHLHLGDALTRLNDTSGAKQAYARYVELRHVKSRPIPERVQRALDARP